MVVDVPENVNRIIIVVLSCSYNFKLEWRARKKSTEARPDRTSGNC